MRHFSTLLSHVHIETDMHETESELMLQASRHTVLVPSHMHRGSLLQLLRSV